MWNDLDPPARDIIMTGKMLIGSRLDGTATFCIDKMPNADFRASVGNLFGSLTVATGGDLETVMRRLHKKARDIE